MTRAAATLADDLVGFVTRVLADLEAHHAPGLRLPRVFAGHRVASDVPADLAFTLGHLRSAGVDEVAGLALDDAIAIALTQVDGPATHSFFSYRVAETLAAYGPFERNAMLDRFEEAGRANLAEACDSSSFLPLLDTLLPVNYAAVLARCELARDRLGILPDRSVLDDLVARTARRFDTNPFGFLDDSHDDSGRFDIYTPDVYLFCEPLAGLLGERWARGARHALGLVERVATRNGAGIVWGRSAGALAGALTMELASLAVTHDLSDDPVRWVGLGANALDRYDGWFRHGLITAHQHRSTYDYRGPFRRLQMTLDILGKLAYAAAGIRTCVLAAPAVDPLSAAGRVGDPSGLFPARNEWIPLDDRNAGVWSLRSRDLAFVLPAVGGSVSDYVPAPRNPGMFEVPVDSEHATFVPTAYVGLHRFAPTGRPAAVEAVDDGLRLRHERLAPMRKLDPGPDPAPEPLAASRDATYCVEGRVLRVREHLHFERVPDAIALSVPEVQHRPLRVEFRSDRPHRVDHIDVLGLKEWRSYWSLLSTVHQIDVEPATDVTLEWSVEPLLRVALTAHEHHYNRTIYGPLAGRVLDMPFGSAADPIDQLHLHWPEWSFFAPDGATGHQREADALRRAGIRVVWTQHNLTPHFKQPDLYDPIYAVWAQAADAAIHHSDWGRERVLERYRFRDDCLHVTIPHPHFGGLMPARRPDRAEAEAALGLEPCGIRLGILGAPRAEKDVAFFADAFAACGRDDLSLCIWSLRPGEQVPDDPRIRAWSYDMVDRDQYDLRLAACDVLVLPFQGHDMLATGTAADAVGAGLPALVSDWPFLTEYLGDAGIPYGRTRDDVIACLDALDAGALDRAARASRARQALYDPAVIAQATYEVLDAVGTEHL